QGRVAQVAHRRLREGPGALRGRQGQDGHPRPRASALDLVRAQSILLLIPISISISIRESTIARARPPRAAAASLSSARNPRRRSGRNGPSTDPPRPARRATPPDQKPWPSLSDGPYEPDTSRRKSERSPVRPSSRNVNSSRAAGPSLLSANAGPARQAANDNTAIRKVIAIPPQQSWVCDLPCATGVPADRRSPG